MARRLAAAWRVEVGALVKLARREAIGIAWSVPENERETGKRMADAVFRRLAALHRARSISAVLPFRHRPLRVSDSFWTGYWLIVLSEGADPGETWTVLERTLAERSAADARVAPRMELLHSQPGIDMYYPLRGGLRREPRWHWVEYAVTRPEARIEYYNDQYVFSAGVIQRFYGVGAVKRCIGFERTSYFRNQGALPEWDVIHITGFSPARLPHIGWTLWRSMRYFDMLARKVGHEAAFDVFRSWDKLRSKYQGLAFQDPSRTLQSIYDPSLVP